MFTNFTALAFVGLSPLMLFRYVKIKNIFFVSWKKTTFFFLNLYITFFLKEKHGNRTKLQVVRLAQEVSVIIRYVENPEPKKFLVCSLISVSGSKLPRSDLYDEVQRCCIYFKAWNLTSLCHAASNLACTQLISHSAWYHTYQFMHLHWEALKWVTKGCFYITPHLIYLQASECFPLKKSGMRFKSACASFPAVSFFLEGWAPFLCLRIMNRSCMTNQSFTDVG